jgi:hypothetical protein
LATFSHKREKAAASSRFHGYAQSLLNWHEAGRCVIAVVPQRGQRDRAKYRAKRISQANKLAQSDHCTALTTAHR